jgi:hypothetical protein
MKRVIVGVLLAALVFAAPAAAKQPNPKAATNAAHLCKALQAANPGLFKSTYGTNANKSNAYGKCVSAAAKSKRHPGTITLSNIALTSTGTVLTTGAAGCQFTAIGCTLTSSGTVGGPWTGTYTSTFTILWASASTYSNGVGGFCAPATGTVILTLTGLGTITKQETGPVCEVGATGLNVAHTFNGTFIVQSGTGVFAGATGSGTTTFNQQPGASDAVGGTVTGTETITTLTLKV